MPEQAASVPPGSLPLLRGKMTVPRVPGRFVARPRLYAHLCLSAQFPVTTVIAPAGWGKTLLLCAWFTERPPAGRAAWLSLDARDSDPVRFWAYVLAVVRDTYRLDDTHPLSALSQPLGADDAQIDSFVALFVDALDSLTEPITLVLDDVHDALSPAVARGLGVLLQHSPRQLRLVLAGRSLPGLSLDRARVAGEVMDLGAQSLAFTDDEVVSVFRSAGIDVPPDQLAWLRERAEGWPAGIRLAEMSMRRAEDPATLIGEFSGDLTVVADYLMSEVLDQLDLDVTAFLMRTSIVDRLTPELAHQLSGRADAATILDAMERSNTFIVSTGRAPTYRFHQMFREMLQHRLQRELPDEVDGLHRSAAAWYVANGHPIDAARHAVAGGDWGVLRSAVRDSWVQLYLDGELATLGKMLGQIPETIVQTDAELSFVRAAMHLALDHLDLAQQDIERGERLAEQTSGSAAESVVVARAMVALDSARLAGDVTVATAAAETLLSKDKDNRIRADVRAMAHLHLGVTEYFNGDRRAAERSLKDGLALAQSAGRDYVALGCLSQLTIVLTAQNRPSEGLRVAHEAIALAEHRGWNQTRPMTGGTWHALGWIHYLRDELDDAAHYLQRAEEAVRSGDSGSHGSIRMVQGLVAALRDDKVGAMGLFEDAAADLEASLGSFIFAPYLLGEPIRILAAMGHLDAAQERLQSLEDGPTQPTHVALARAELHLAHGATQAAVQVLAPGARCAAPGFLDQWLQAQVLTAIIVDSAGQTEQADALIDRAIGLGAPEEFRQPFVRFGGSVVGLLARAAAREQTHGAYVADVLERASRRPGLSVLGPDDRWQEARPEVAQVAIAVDDSPSPIAELLTERELDVLGCLSEMMTTPEIAAELFVSVNTVKAHLKHIFAKLDVANRRQAVNRARELGFLVAR